MHRFHRFMRVMALATCGGIFWMWGAGSCLPYNFYSTLLADSIVATFVSTIVGGVAGGFIPAQ